MNDAARQLATSYPAGVGRGPVRAVDAISVSYRLVLGQMRSTGRIVALTLLSLTATVAGFAVGRSDDPTVDQAAAVIANLGFAVVVPVVCLVFAGGAIGDLREDKTLVYESMIHNLYGLGSVLRKKFALLMGAYTSFMVALILGVSSFIGVFVWILQSVPTH